MARIRATLVAVVTAGWRDFKSVGSFSGNNLFVVGLVLLALGDPGVFVALTAFIGLILFIPLSADPLRVLPRERITIWPLSAGERRALRILSPCLSPATWLIVALAVWKDVTADLYALMIGVLTIGFVLPSLPPARKGAWRRLPNFPGPLNQLIRKNLREMLSMLDVWCSAVVSAISFGFRAAGLLPADALLPLTILIMLPLSTCAQTLFGLDGDSGMTRYGLLPVPGWLILSAKDVPFLFLSVVMTLPLAPGAGLAAALSALATGHHASVTHHSNQVRWRFSSGASFSMSIFQVIVMFIAAAAVYAIPLLILPCVGIYAWSTSWCGRLLERRPL